MKKIFLSIVIILMAIVTKAQSPYTLSVCGSISSPFSGVYTNTITMTIAQGGTVNTYTTTLNGSPQFCFAPISIPANFGNYGVYSLTLSVDSCAPQVSIVDTIVGAYSPYYTLQLCPNACNASITTSNTPNGGVTLTANSSLLFGVNYLWNTGETTPSISATSNGTYTVTISDINGQSCTASTTVSVCSVSVNSSSSNLGANFINLTAVASGTPPFTYLWNNNQTSQSIVGNTGANYCVNITDATGCVASICDTAYTQCTASMGMQGNTLIASSTGMWPFNYTWSLNGVALAAGTETLVVSQPGLYSCTVLDNNGCYSTAYFNVTACNLMTASSSISSITNPNGTFTCTANVSGGQAPYTYLWSDGSTAASTTVYSTGPVCVTISDATGCSTSFCDTLSSTCNFTVTLNASIAGGGMLTANVSVGVTPLSYSWTLNGIAYPATSSYLFLSQPGLYCCTITDMNGCLGTACYTYTGSGCNMVTTLNSFIPPNVPPNTVMGLSANTTGGTSPYYYSWSLNGAILPDTAQNITVSQTGLYQVSVTDIAGCMSIDTMYLNLSGQANCSVSITDTIIWNTHLLTANSTGTWPFAYVWTLNNNFVDTASTIFPTLPGTYTVTSTDASGCVSTYSIFVSQPCVDATSYSIPLNGGPVVINAASSGVAPLSYSWTLNGLPMSTTQSSVTTTINGTYCYTITDATGCTVSNCYTYTSSPTGSCTAFFTTAFDSLYLPSSNNMLVDFTSYPNGLPPFTYNWVFSDGSTSNLANPQHVFYYSNVADLMWAWASLTITDATGCTSTYNNSVPMPPSYYGCNAFFTSSSYYNASTTGLVQFTNLSATQDTGATYFWTFGDSSYSYSQNPSHVFQASGVYYVCLTVTNSFGCSASYCESIYIDLNWWNGNPYSTGCTAGYVLVPNYAAPGTVLIVDVSQVNNASYMWNTSNGFMTNAPNPFFSLTGPGTFTLCATVTDTLTGCSDTFCDSLSIDSLGNVFKTGSNTFLSANATVSFVVVSAPKNAQATGITDNKDESTVLLYPNPANNCIEISNWNSNETSTLSMYDVAGGLVLEKKLNANSTTNKTDISGLSNGSYVVKLSDSKHSSLSKLLINH